MEQAIKSPFFSREETAEFLRCSLPTVDRYIRDGELESKKIGPRRRLVLRESVYKKAGLEAG